MNTKIPLTSHKIYKKTRVQKMPKTLKTKAFVLKSKNIYYTIVRKEKIKKALLSKQTKILLFKVCKILYYAMKKEKDIHTPHQFYNIKYIP